MRAGSLCQGFATGFREAFHLAPVLELVNLVRVLQGFTQSDICLPYAIPKAFVAQALSKGLKCVVGSINYSRKSLLNLFKHISGTISMFSKCI